MQQEPKVSNDDDASIFPTTLACLSEPQGREGPFISPPANCLISCCRWRAVCCAGGAEREKAQVGLSTLTSFVAKLQWLRATAASLWSFVEIPQ